MKTSTIISLAIATMGVLGAAGAQAESYDGVHPLTTANSRADVRSQAVVAAHGADPYADGANAGVQMVAVSDIDRAAVRAQAVVAAHSADPYADGASAVPMVFASSLDRAAVHAQAVATARSPSIY